MTVRSLQCTDPRRDENDTPVTRVALIDATLSLSALFSRLGAFALRRPRDLGADAPVWS